MRQIEARLPRTGTKINRLIDFSGKSDLATLAGVLARPHTVVSNDSGAMHLAGCGRRRVSWPCSAPPTNARTSPLRAAADAPAPVS